MNLITNTGIQLFAFKLDVNPDNRFKMFFHEWYAPAEQMLKLEIAHCFDDDAVEVWVKKRHLTDIGYATWNNDYNDYTVTEPWPDIWADPGFDNSCIIPIETADPRDSGCFHVALNNIRWEKFENVWLPCPFFLRRNDRSEFGPTNWCRLKLIPREAEGNARKYNLLLAFDTNTKFERPDEETEDWNETPVFNDNDMSKEYALCNNEYKLIDYCSAATNCEWVDKYVLQLYHKVGNISELPNLAKPKMHYIAQYIYIMRYIQKFANVPPVTLKTNRNVPYSKVDLVVDIGNSRTCAVLFDNSDFTKSSPLELQDFTTPVKPDGTLNKYRDSFDMRLAFREAWFGGKFGIANSRQFVYPSMVRLGREANDLIHKATNMNTGAEKTSTFSSPKRFLWDTKPQKTEWEFVRLEGEKPNNLIEIKGISEQLNEDGSLNTDGNAGIVQHFSRKALMTFAFLEILAQARMQINSGEQRKHWGNESLIRRIGRIIVTCPTGMSRLEQKALRQCAEDAAIMLDRFFGDTYNEEINEREARKAVEVIPAAAPPHAADRTQWIYDEATAAQFVYLYAEICERYRLKVKEFFDFYGKVRSDLGNYNKNSLTVASVDVGAGTTDVMIAAYKYDDSIGQCTLTPVPLFWESFYKAGDDLMKELIHRLVIEGRHSPIERKLRAMGIEKPVDLMQLFLGTDNGVSFRNRQLRSDFNLQVSVPIISAYLELLKLNAEEHKVLSFAELFRDNPPTEAVLNRFIEHFGFDFKELQWRYDRRVVADIVEQTFDTLIGKISSLCSHYACDIVLLSGRPTSLKPLSDLFLKYYAISPNRLKSMNDYRVGRWYPQDERYPFVDGNGQFLNPKSIVTTGAMIGHLAANGGINGFTLNLQELIARLIPTTNYFGKLDPYLHYTQTVISPKNNRADVVVTSLPFRLGMRQIDIPAYPARPFYTLNFDDFRLEDRVKGSIENENDVAAVQAGVDALKNTIIRNMPLTVSIERDFSEDKEMLTMESATGADGKDYKRFLCLQVQSMSEVDNFWLDSGIFSLNINN